MTRHCIILFSFFCLAVCFTTSTLQADCRVSTNPLAFGEYDPIDGGDLMTEGAVIIYCPGKGGSLKVTVSISQSFTSGLYQPRQMTAGLVDRLEYNIYSEHNSRTIFGDGTNGTVTMTKEAKHNRDLIIPLYGTIPGGQNPSAGNYYDSVTVTVSW